jgi:hypothetical protein
MWTDIGIKKPSKSAAEAANTDANVYLEQPVGSGQ